MNKHESFSDSIYEEQSHVAERELFSFIAAVTELYGPEQAKLAASDWLDQSDLMDSPPDLRSEIGARSRSRHLLDWQVESTYFLLVRSAHRDN